MKRCNCRPKIEPRYTPGPVQTSASTLYPAMMPRHAIPGTAPLPMPGLMPAPGPMPPVETPKCKCRSGKKPGTPSAMVEGGQPPPYGCVMTRPPVPIPEPCSASSSFKTVEVEGTGDVKVDKIDEVDRTIYVVSFDGFDKRYEMVPYTRQEISDMFDQIDDGVDQ